MLFTNSTDFVVQAKDFHDTLSLRMNSGSNRGGVTQNLKNLQRQMNDALKEVKVYIAMKFKKENAIANYAQFGIVNYRGKYILPQDNNNLINSLQMMIAAINNNGMAGEEFGAAFWADMLVQFQDAWQKARDIDGQVSGTVGNKNTKKNGVIKVLNGMVLSIKANHPEDYKNVLRQFGFQKEKF